MSDDPRGDDLADMFADTMGGADGNPLGDLAAQHGIGEFVVELHTNTGISGRHRVSIWSGHFGETAPQTAKFAVPRRDYDDPVTWIKELELVFIDPENAHECVMSLTTTDEIESEIGAYGGGTHCADHDPDDVEATR